MMGKKSSKAAETNAPEAKDLSSLMTFEGISNTLNEIRKSNTEILIGLGKIDEEAMNVVKTFGLGKEQVLGIKQAYAASRDEIIKVGGEAKDFWKNQTDAAGALGRNITLSSEAQRDLTAAFRTSGQEVKTIITAFKDVGISAEDAGKRMAGVLDAARQTGVSAEKVSSMVLTNTSMLNQYNFQGGVDGLAKMAAQAVSMRFDVKDMANTMEKAFNPESAIRMAAELQRLGVQQSALLDPLQLMNMAENDPAELQNQIVEMSKQFTHLNEKGQFEILPGAKRQMREIEKSLGLAPGHLAKMSLASAELDEKMSKIRFPEIATEEQKKLLANISEMKDGKVMIDVGGKKVELAEAMQGKNKEQIDALIEASRPKSVDELAKDQLNALEKINVGIQLMSGRVPDALAATKGGENITRGIETMYSKALEEAVKQTGGSTKEMVKNMSKYVDDVGVSFNKLIKGDGSLEDLTKAIEKAKESINNDGQNFFLDLFSKLEKELPYLKNKATDAATTFIGEDNILKASQIFQDAVNNFKIIFGSDVIVSKEGIIKTAPEDTIVAATGLDKIMEMVEGTSIQSKVTPTELPISNLPKISEQISNQKIESKQSVTSEQNINFKLTIDAPPQVDKTMIERILKDRGVTEQIIANIKNVKSNSNLTPSLV